MKNDESNSKATGMLSGISEALKIAVQGIENQAFLLVVALFIVATIAIVALSIGSNETWSLALSIAAILIFFILLIFLLFKLRSSDRHSDTIIKVDTLGSLRSELEKKDEDELDKFRKKHKLSDFPRDRNTQLKKAKWLFETIPFHSLKPANIKFERGFFFTAILIFLLGSGLFLYTWKENRPSTQEEVIHDFFKGINEGRAGNSQGWSLSWEILSLGNKQRISERFPGEYPAEFASLYKGSGYHKVQAIDLVEQRSGKMHIFLVIYSVEENHPKSSISQLLAPQHSLTISDFYSEFQDSNDIVERILVDLNQYYELPNKENLLEELKNYLLENVNLSDLASPRLPSVIASRYKLKPLGVGAHPQFGRRHFTTLDISYFRMIDGLNGWKIDKIAPQAQHFVPMHLR